MSDLRQRLATLSGEERAGLERRLKEESLAATAEPIGRRRGGIPAPLSFAQERLWVLDRLNPGLPSYNIPMAFRLRGPLDLPALRRALEAILDRHEVLRTVFVTEDGTPVQRIATAGAPALSVVDLSALEDGEREERSRRLLDEAAWSPFDLAKGPLLRAKLLRLSGQEHILAVAIHHIVFDGWSSEIFWRELASLYEAYREGRPSPLPALPIQYADFAVWQRQRLQGEVLEEQISYWKRKLEGAPAVLELPASRQRPSRQSFRGATETLSIPGAVADAIRLLGQREGATLFMTLLAAFSLLLSRHCGQQDILVGTPVAGRNRSDIEDLIGFFVNTLVLRTDLSDDPTFRQLLGRVREAAIGAFEHQDLPFEKLVEALEPKRDLSRTPIFQILFNVLNFGAGQLRLAELEVDRIEIPLASLFDLTLYVEEARDGIRLSAVFDPELFERAYVSELLEQLVGLLEQVASAPQQRVGSYSLLTASARRLLPDPAVPIPEPEVGIAAEDVLSWSDRAPSAPAVALQGRVWTYRELAERSRAIAESLLERGLEKGDVVGIEGERSFGLIAGMLGVLRSGGVMLTLDPALPRERRRLMLSEARARTLVLVDASAQEDPAGDGPDPLPAIRVDENGLCAKAGTLAPDASLPQISPNDPAYIFFTSGTSGVPKAVLGSQKGLSHFLRWQREAFEVRPGDRCAQLTALSFDVLLRDVFLPLTSGATLHLPDAREEAGSSRTVSWLEREGITVLHTVPSVADSWLTASPGGAPLARLRWAFLSGEPLSDTLVRRWFSAFPESGRIVNLYGATEATLAQCFFVVPAEPPPGIQPLGRPLPETQALILADGKRLCGIGEPGEIVLRTPFRSLGYLNAPCEQQERFVPNPFRIAEGDILYRTGDRGRYGIDGSLEILGRWDDQVKIRGVRVEPAEVASVLSGHRSVGSCAVIARADAHGETMLLAYVVSPHPGPETAAELRSHLSARLPAAMLPSAFVFLEQLPRNPNGKLDRRALPPPEPVPEKRDEPLELPRTPVEKTVATMWTAVLRLERIGIQEDFFELGGHSLNATQMMSRVNQAFRLDMPVRALFENPSIASLSSAIESSLLDEWQRAARGGAREHAIEAPPSRAKGRLDESGDCQPVPDAVAGTSRPRSRPATSLSFAQERLWVLDRVNPALSFYNIASAFRLIGSLDVEALERALGSIEERHEVLRAYFVTEGGRPVQVIGPVRAPALSVVDLEEVEEGARETEARRIADEEARRPFDLSRGPLVRAKLLRLSGQEHILAVAIHHIVFDGWSSEIFWRELASLYEAYREGRPSPLPALPIQYADFAVWQRQRLQGEVLEEQISYWKRKLEGAPAVLELPASRQRPSRQSFRGATETLSIPGAVADAIRLLGQREGATLYMTLLAAFSLLLSRHCGQQDILVGTPVAGRNRSDIEDLIGFFVNTLVLRTDLSDDPTFRQLLGRVRQIALEAYAHQDLPFERLVEQLNPQRTLAYSPIFQVMMVMQNSTDPQLRLPELSVARLPLETSTSKFDLTAFFTDTGKQIEVSFQYNTDLFEASTVRRMLSHLEVLLSGIAEEPDQRVSLLPLLTARERHQVLVEWNQTQTPYPREMTVHRLFEEQASERPEAIAVQMEGQLLTYGQLNERANRLAWHLIERGVGPETLVGLCVERSPEMVVGLLGILKAGAAYLPLDPGYPRERLRFMVDDAGANLVLTQHRLANSLPQSVQLLRLDADWPDIAPNKPVNPPSTSSPDNLAYVIYTSGSTGLPKGVEVEHGSLTNHIGVAADRFGVRIGERILQFSSLNFDASAQEIFSTLTRGGTLVLRTEEMIETVATFLARCRDWGLTVLDLPTSYWHELVAVASAENLRLPESIRVVLFGGERALPERFAQWQAMTGGRVRLINAFGPTEATIAATMWDTVGPVESLPRIVPIGRPIANVRIYVLDARLQPVPVEVAGEIYLGGVCPARGYRNRPELTAERFVPDPFGSGKGRLYRTGDRVRFRPDGELEYLGRVDSQVKVRGFRVEPGEIETALRAIPGVSDAVVRAREDAPGQARLIGYVVADPARAPSVGDLRRRLKESLPEYMLPSAFVLVDALPKTRSGKLDAAALPAPEPARPALDGAYVGPRTPIEETLTDIWKSVLRLDRVGVHDDFFELGGHSLLATQVISRARDAFHVEVPLQDLFVNPTVEGLALAIAERQAGRIAAGKLEDLLSEVKAAAGAAASKAR